MSNAAYYQMLRNADRAVEEWCNGNAVSLHGVHHVATWAEWSDGIGVFFFLTSNADLEALSPTQAESLQRTYLESLKESDYPFDKFPEVRFEIDSDENVRDNFEGSYFYRLR